MRWSEALLAPFLIPLRIGARIRVVCNNAERLKIGQGDPDGTLPRPEREHPVLALVGRTRRAQGLPATVSDPSTLTRVAALLLDSPATSQDTGVRPSRRPRR